MPRFDDIPQFTRDGQYRVHVPWESVARTLVEFAQGAALDLDPDFQRGHVWTAEQQVRYVEFALRGGKTGRDILFNCPTWNRGRASESDPLVLVDGKQRLEAVRRFLGDEIGAFGHRFSEYEDRLGITGPQFVFVVNDLKTRAEVLQWYIDLNSGGTPHADSEIERVRTLLATERA
jgi:hypothetical protein